jgi:hypothetical protein
MSRRLRVTVVLFTYLPVVAVAVASGFAFGWRVPVAFAIVMALLIYRTRRTVRHTPAISRMRSLIEFLAFALVGSIIGGLLFGGVGVILGFAFGVTVRLSEVPITTRRRSE